MATSLMPALLAGIVMAGILASTISSSDSYLLIASSAAAKNLYQGLFNKATTDKQVMRVTRVVLITIALIAMVIALDENSVIFEIVSFAWAGFGAAFGPVMLFSLFYRKLTESAAIAGMLSGGLMVFVWKLLVRPLGGFVNIYELLPAFLFSCLVILLVSRFSKQPTEDILADFDRAKIESKQS